MKLTADEAQRIKRALGLALAAVHFKYPKRKFGVLIENRGTQITFSALGQRAPLPLKGKWNRDSDIRPKITQALKKLLPDFEVREGGLTSIDVTKKGIDKGYAVRRLMKILRMRKEDLVFIGDALFPGGNDYSVKKTGILCVRVSNPDETKEVIRNFEFRNRKFKPLKRVFGLVRRLSGGKNSFQQRALPLEAERSGVKIFCFAIQSQKNIKNPENSEKLINPINLKMLKNPINPVMR